ncbi:hypothetical protein [Niabella beijingensis]|uniref:hypothetical protein n=1 Tax=Niabella beijingensis TaxID=2872700 RepID=UPI001CBD6285|nr:hypothetical protein [Niabella beijingensis]MBZ4192491.1 hypothetical protein [Niabella beijingensis]
MKQFIVRERRYTRDHEWVDFYGDHAMTGISWFKLIGFRQIQKVLFVQPVTGFRREGDVLAVIVGNDYQITAHMPVDGNVIRINETLLSEPVLLLDDPGGEGWIAEIAPWEINHNTRLLCEEEYDQKYKRPA